MGKHNHNLSALIGSRICHDLISPIGAITNGLELIAMGGGSGGPEMALINDSVENASARIRFFRIAYGVASQGQYLSNREIRDILSAVSRNGRITMELLSPEDGLRGEVQAVFLAAQCIETALPFGGTIAIEQQDAAWVLTGRGQKLKILPELWTGLSLPERSPEIQPAQVQFALLPEVLAKLERKLAITSDDGQISIRF